MHRQTHGIILVHAAALPSGKLRHQQPLENVSQIASDPYDDNSDAESVTSDLTADVGMKLQSLCEL